MEAQVGPYDNDGTARVVYALTQEVLAETSLLAADIVTEGAIQAAGGAFGGGSGLIAFAGAVHERINGFLKHAPLIIEQNGGDAVFHHAAQAVIPLNKRSVKIIEVGNGEAPAWQGNEGPKFGRHYGDHPQDHPFGAVLNAAVGGAKLFYNLEPP
jgi:hypothetical protein